MTLWDKQPLTESEVAGRAVCKCGATAAEHVDVQGDDEQLWEKSHERWHLLHPGADCSGDGSGNDCEFDPREFCYRAGCTEFREDLRA